MQLPRSLLARVKGIPPANCRRKMRVVHKRSRKRRVRRRKNKQLRSLLRAKRQKHIFRRIPETDFERRIHQNRSSKSGCWFESIFGMDQVPRPKFCPRRPRVFAALPHSTQFSDPFGRRVGSNLPWLLFSDISDRMVGVDCGYHVCLMCGGAEYGN